MKREMIAIALLAVWSNVATADDQGCKVEGIKIELTSTVKWTGPCVNGYAEGTGTLDLMRGETELLHYEGSMQRGRMHGIGYLRQFDNDQFEGNFEKGRFHGFGIALTRHGKYEGEWNRGRREGRGKMIFALGGQYDGEWKNHVFHGKGNARYISGREVTTEFVNGRRIDQQPLSKAEAKYGVREDSPRTGSRIKREVVHNGVVPFSQSYDEMSESDREIVRSVYPLLDDGDEPPYPAGGSEALYKAIAKVTGKLGVKGRLYMLVEVDANGSAINAATYATPSPEFAKAVMGVALLQKYKPGTCAGKPCTMKFPVSVAVSAD